MNTEESYRVHMAIEYIKHRLDCGESFAWEPEDIDDEFYTILGFYGVSVEEFTSESLTIMKEELLELSELEQEKEIIRIYGVET